MALMSMNKVIHAAFRRDLARFIAALQAFTAEDTTRANQLGVAWRNFDAQLVTHHEGEHEIAWPALESVGVSPDLIAEMDAEHDVMAQALAAARTAMQALQRTASAEQAAEALSALEHLKSATESHLDHEERELEPVYQAAMDTPEIKAMGKAFGKVSPAVGGTFFAWVSDGATADERAALADSVPGPVLKIIGGIFGRGYRKNVATVWTS